MQSAKKHSSLQEADAGAGPCSCGRRRQAGNDWLLSEGLTDGSLLEGLTTGYVSEGRLLHQSRFFFFQRSLQSADVPLPCLLASDSTMSTFIAILFLADRPRSVSQVLQGDTMRHECGHAGLDPFIDGGSA